jgi:predicted nuclease of predicted toxin-antitoxin system
VKFLLDHDVSSYVFHALRAAKHEVFRLIDVLPRESDDETVFNEAYKRGYVMITCNRDDYLVLAKNYPFHGLIIVIRRNPPVLEGQRIRRLLKSAGEDGISGNINFA